MVLALFFRWCRLRRTHILIIRLRLFAVKEEKMGLRCQSSASIRHPRFFFSLCLKRGYRKKGNIGPMYRCIGLHLEGSSFLRWTIRSPLKGTVHFYRECERVMICDWNRERLYYCISYLFPKCSHGSMVLLIFYSWRVMHYMFMMYIGVVLTKW